MANPILQMLGQGQSLTNNLFQNAEIADFIIKGYNAYNNKKLDVFFKYNYENNAKFKEIYDKYKNKTLSDFLSEMDINL